VEKGAEVEVVISNIAMSGSIVCSNQLAEINLSEKSKFSLVNYYNFSGNADLMDNIFVNVGKQAAFKSTNILLKGDFVQNNLEVNLQGDSSEAYLAGLYVGREKNRISQRTKVIHQGQNTVSKQNFKGVATDSSAVALGLNLQIKSSANQAKGEQEHAGILLSNTAKIAASPELNVDNGSVECSHGSSLGALDETALFYMCSRGINETDAQKMLQKSYLDEIILSMDNEELRKTINTEVEERINA